MAQKRVETGRGRKSGVVKASKKSATSNRAFYLIIAAVAVAGISALTYQSTRPKGAETPTRFDTTLAPVASNGYLLGSPTAPFEVTEFADFECPTCGRFATLVEPDVRSRLINTGQIRLRYIDYPLDMHRNTWNASRAAACADEQGKFWEMHDAIYATQDRWNGEATTRPDGVLKDLAKPLGMDMDKFNACVDSKATQAKIQAHLAIATARRIPATPTFIIGDQQHSGAIGFDQFKKAVDEALAKGPTRPAHSSLKTSTSKARRFQNSFHMR